MTKLEERSDEELMEGIRGGEQECMDVLIERYKGQVRKEARTLYLIGGDSDDLIQEGMLGLFKAIRDYRPEKEASFGSFAKLCISRQLYTAIQAASRQKHSPLNTYVELTEGLDDVSDSSRGKSPEELLIDQESAESLQDRIEALLSPMEYGILQRYLNGENYVQIAEGLERNPKSIDNALQRVKRKLEKHLYADDAINRDPLPPAELKPPHDRRHE